MTSEEPMALIAIRPSVTHLLVAVLAACDVNVPLGGMCTSNTQCTTTLSAGGLTIPAVCVQPEAKCVALKSDDCSTITGDYLEPDPVIVPDDAVLIASLLATTGPQGPTNLARQQA